jgi:hypothetical protein
MHLQLNRDKLNYPSSLGGDRWKRAARHLAGGLPYGTHGFGAEVDRAICPSTVTMCSPQAETPAWLVSDARGGYT